MHCWWECKNGLDAVETSLTSTQKLNIQLLYDPAIPLLHTDQRENKTMSMQKIYTWIFITLLFIMGKKVEKTQMAKYILIYGQMNII